MMNRLFTTLLFFCTVIAMAAQTLTDGRRLYRDEATGTYLCSVPEEWFDDGRVGQFRCDTADIDFTFLPIVALEGDFGYDYSEGTVTVEMPDEAKSNRAMKAKLKWRGGTTNLPGKHKRNYSVKFINADGSKKDRKLFSLRNDNHWILEAAQMDRSRIRNRMATDLWNDFATKPYYFADEPKALTGTRGQFVEVFLNGEYRGLYCMTECIDRSQMKLMKYDDDLTIHGQLWKATGFANANMWNYTPYDNLSDTWGGFETEYPDMDDVSPTDYSVLHDFVKFVVDASDADLDAHIGEYLDLPVMVDYYVMVYVLAGIDNYSGKNLYWACYDRETSHMLTPAPWDLDCTVGNHFLADSIGSWEVTPETHTDRYWALNLFYRLDSCNLAHFSDLTAARYRQLRNGAFSTESLVSRYTSCMDMLAKAGAYGREQRKWSGDSDIFYQSIDYATERQFITDWLTRRLETIDSYGLPSGIRHTTAKRKPAEGIYNIQGQRLASPPSKGIYIRDGKAFAARRTITK